MRLWNIIHHRNQLKNYRNTIHLFNNLFDAVSLDMKLKVPLKYKSQSMHWTGVEIIVHSGILKKEGEKQYHAYLSDDLIQDHVFVNQTLEKMLEEVDHTEYKCAAHFDKMQKIADKYCVKVIRYYGIPGHGKGEVDHVGGLTKVAVRREVAATRELTDTEEMVQFLQMKLAEKADPSYVFKNIICEDLEEERKTDRFLKYKTIVGSAKFQVVVFTPNKKLKASSRMCICETCQTEYGSCDLFKEYGLVVQELKQTCLRSGVGEENLGIEVNDDMDEIVQEQTANEIQSLHWQLKRNHLKHFI